MSTISQPQSVEINRLIANLGADLDSGLSLAEADDRLAQYGPNSLVSTPPVPVWRRFLAQFHDPLIYLLLGAIAISLGAWWFQGHQGWPIDAMVIIFIVVANACIGFFQESRAIDAVAALRRMTRSQVTVRRGGQARLIAADDLVPGDILLLQEGDNVGADARLVEANALTIAEAALTGESTAVTKHPGRIEGEVPLGDRHNMVFRGTAVTQGTGVAVVTATGMDTEVGAVATMLSDTEQEETPLAKEIASVSRWLGVIVIVIAVLVMVTISLTSNISTMSDAVTVLFLGVSLAVAAVPEGLPAILSIVLSIGVQRMAARNAIVKDLHSVETLGSASVICSDKTGTLTTNEMTIQQVKTEGGTAHIAGVGYEPIGEVTCSTGQDINEVYDVLAGGALASNAELHREADDSWEIVGDPTEAAFFVAERKLADPIDRETRYERRGEVPFSSERKRMTTLSRDRETGEFVVVMKGAPDVVAKYCAQVDEEQVRADVAELSDQALRTIGIASRRLHPEHISEDLEDLERELIYEGTVGMIDPPRQEVREAISQAQRAGIRVVMITGDHPATALRIAQDLGLVTAGGTALSGIELDKLTDAEFAEAVQDVNVFARVAPQHKLRIVDALQDAGHVVAMTGDGVNDAPALKSADIGVAMGITGTEVTKDAGAMILRDDNFATIIAAVRQGRDIFDNIKKFLRYLLSSNMGEVCTVFFGVIFAGALGLRGASTEDIVLPLLATQILWINLITDTGPALALGLDPETDDTMGRPPRATHERVINVGMWGIIFWVGAVMAVSALLTMDFFLVGGFIPGSDNLEVARTAAFTTLVFSQLFNVFSSRSTTHSAFKDIASNKWLLGAVILGVVLQFMVVEVPFLQSAFGTASLDFEHWVVTIGFASLVLWAEESRKLIARIRNRV